MTKRLGYQYRIVVGDTTGPISDTYLGAQWAAIVDDCEARGLPARFERRLVTTSDLLDLIEDATGYITLGQRVVCPWELLAAMR